MANYYGSARTNAVTIIDKAGLEKALEPFSGLTLSERQDGRVVFLGDDCDSGSFPSCAIDEGGNDLEFSWEEHIMPYVAEGEVLVIQEAGAERLRYIVGYSVAYMRIGDEVKSVGVDINDIYEKVAAEFNLDVATINTAEY